MKVMTELDQIIQEVANIRTASDRQAVSVNNIKKGVEDINDFISPTPQQQRRLPLPASFPLPLLL